MIHPSGEGFVVIRRLSLLLLAIASLTTGLPVEPSSARQAAPGDERWVTSYDSPVHKGDGAWAVAINPDGTKVFVTGSSEEDARFYSDLLTIAYDAATGKGIWTKRYGRKGVEDFGLDIAVSPDGATVFVTGYSVGLQSYSDYATIAYQAATGTQLWARRYDDPDGGYDSVFDLAVSPDGATVVVTGTGNGDYATVAYDAVTGAELWVTRYSGQDARTDNAFALDVSPDGRRVFVTGESYTSDDTTADFATISYEAATGTELWVKTYGGPAEDTAWDVQVGPDGTKVFVTGQSPRYSSDDYATVAYDASRGAQIWQRRYNGPADGYDQARALAVSPDGTRVIVTGQSYGTGLENDDYATVAYDAATGSAIWHRRYDGPGSDDDVPYAIGVSPDGTEVYVTGQGDGGYLYGYGNYLTIAYDLATGRTRWIRAVHGQLNGSDGATDLAVSPDGAVLFVTGSTLGQHSSDLTTVAYSTS